MDENKKKRLAALKAETDYIGKPLHKPKRKGRSLGRAGFKQASHRR
jgi:hypothetical protein